MHARSAFVMHFAGFHLSNDDDVIARRLHCRYAALQMSMRRCQDWYAVVALDFNTLECRLIRLEALAEVRKQILLPLAENAYPDSCASNEPVHKPAFRIHRDANQRRLERALLNPASQHRCFLFAVAKCDNKKAAGDSPQGGQKFFLWICRFGNRVHVHRIGRIDVPFYGFALVETSSAIRLSMAVKLISLPAQRLIIRPS